MWWALARSSKWINSTLPNYKEAKRMQDTLVWGRKDWFFGWVFQVLPFAKTREKDRLLWLKTNPSKRHARWFFLQESFSNVLLKHWKSVQQVHLKNKERNFEKEQWYLSIWNRWFVGFGEERQTVQPQRSIYKGAKGLFNLLMERDGKAFHVSCAHGIS